MTLNQLSKNYLCNNSLYSIVNYRDPEYICIIISMGLDKHNPIVVSVSSSTRSVKFGFEDIAFRFGLHCYYLNIARAFVLS